MTWHFTLGNKLYYINYNILIKMEFCHFFHEPQRRKKIPEIKTTADQEWQRLQNAPQPHLKMCVWFEILSQGNKCELHLPDKHIIHSTLALFQERAAWVWLAHLCQAPAVLRTEKKWHCCPVVPFVAVWPGIGHLSLLGIRTFRGQWCRCSLTSAKIASQ